MPCEGPAEGYSAAGGHAPEPGIPGSRLLIRNRPANEALSLSASSAAAADIVYLGVQAGVFGGEQIARLTLLR
jgi:hypothetical protein